MEGFETTGVPLEVGKEVGTITEKVFEVLQDRGLKAEAQTHEEIELESKDEEEVQVLDEERINAQVPKSAASLPISAQEVGGVHTPTSPVAIKDPTFPSFFEVSHIFSFLAPITPCLRGIKNPPLDPFVPKRPVTSLTLMENPSSQLTSIMIHSFEICSPFIKVEVNLSLGQSYRKRLL